MEGGTAKPGLAHRPVLVTEVLELLAPAGRAVLVDCTIGLGGHAEALLEAAGEKALLIGLDLDEENLRRCRDRLARFGKGVRLFHANFVQTPEVLKECGAGGADALLADLGVASSQLDDAARGLSFTEDGPLDMRLDRLRPTTAADLVNRLSEAELADLIYAFGEERYSRRIARAIAAARKEKPIMRTLELAKLVASAYPPVARRTRRGVHPATRTFLALRTIVNDEPASLDGLLKLLPTVLNVGGRAAVISFHSLEDRRVKRAFADWAATGAARPLNRRVISPGEQEKRDNPRCRSAKLRGVERVA
jgi:16S rRNA (cytosine1402-N4)-methyltransferase